MSSKLDFGQIIQLVADESNSALRVNIVAGSFSVASDKVDGAAFTPNVDSVGISGAYVNEAVPSAVTDGDVGAVRMSTNRNLYTQIRDGLGNERGASVTAANALKTDGSATTQPISATSLPLPTGAATAVKQPALGVSGTASSDVITVQGIAGMTAIKVDGSAVTQPVSGTVTANIGTSGSLALNASVIETHGSPTGGTAGTKSELAGGIYNLTPPTLTDGQQASHQLDTNGNLKTLSLQNGTWNINNVSGTVSLPTGASTSAKQPALGTAGTASADVITIQGIASMTPILVNGSGVTQPVSGTVTVTQGTGTNLHTVVDSGTIAATQSGVWNITNVSGTVSLPTGAATEASLAKLTLAQGSSTSGQTGALVQGAVTTAAPTYTTTQTSPLSLTTAGALRTDSSATTQPVSGTVAATQSGTWTVQPGNTPNTTPWLATISQGGNSVTVSAGGALKVDGSAATQPVSGTIAATQSGNWSTRTQDGSGNAITSVASGANRAINTSEVGFTASEFVRNDYTGTSVTSAAYVTLIASTAAAYNEFEIFDSSGQTLKIAFGAAASEVDKFLVFPGGNGRIKYFVAAGTRVSIRAVSATASVGEISMNLYG